MDVEFFERKSFGAKCAVTAFAELNDGPIHGGRGDIPEQVVAQLQSHSSRHRPSIRRRILAAACGGVNLATRPIQGSGSSVARAAHFVRRSLPSTQWAGANITSPARPTIWYRGTSRAPSAGTS